MTCEEVLSRLSWYLDEELGMREAEAVREHLGGCAPCAARLRELRACDREIEAAVRDLRPSAGFAARVVAAARPKPSPWPRRLAAAAAVLLLALGGSAAYVNSLEAPPLVVSVLGGPSFHADSMGALRVFVTHAATNLPVARAAVRVLLGGAELGKFVTGPAGSIDGFFRVPDLKDGAYPLELVVDSPIGAERLRRQVTVRREYRLLVTTDKPMYQPGQVIRMRALALNAFTLKPRAGDAEFEVLDAKGNRIFSKKTALSEFGIGSAELPLADEVNLGTWKVAVTASGIRQERTVEVARYVLPKFRVDVELDRPSYRPREVVRGTVKAGYFFGKPVRGRVQAKVGNELVTGELREDGTWDFQAPAPPSDGAVPVEVRVTDTADHREAKSTLALVSREPLKVVLYPDGGGIVRGATNTFYLIVSTPDGRPAKAELGLTVNDRSVQVSTDDLGVAKVTADPPYRIRLLRARDAAGNETSEMVNVSGVTREFGLQLDKSAYKGGETMTVRVLGGGAEPVYVDLVKGGQLLLSKVAEKNEVVIDLPPDLFGTVQVVAYRRDRGQPAVRVAYVNLPEGLRIRMRPAKETFRPGEEMPVDFEVLDAAGKPARMGLGVAVVDEALYARIEAKAASEKAWLSLAPELIDTRGFLKAEAAEIFQGRNANAQGFAGGNGAAPRPEPIAQSDYPRRVAELRRFVDRFNETIRGVVVAAAGIAGVMVVGLLFGVPLVDLCRRMARRSAPGWVVPAAVGLALLAFALGVASGADGLGMVLVVLAGGVLVLGVYATFWWIGRGRPVSGVVTLVIGLGSLAVLVPTVGRSAGPRRVVFSHERLAAPRPSAAAEPAAVPRENEVRRLFEERKEAFDMTVARSEAAPVPEVPKPAPPREAPGEKFEAEREHRVGDVSSREPARVREYFPETLFWLPELITDEKGRARVTLPAADSITSWRMLVNGISRTGALGFEKANLRVFQDFFVDIDFPVALTKGDRVHVPVAVYNYLKEPQAVTVRAQKEPWFELLDEESKTLRLNAGEVSVVYFGLKAKEHGRKSLTVFADGKVRDAIRRSVEVFEKGREVPFSASDRIAGRHTFTVEIPGQAIEGTAVAFARLTPGAGDLVTGLQGLIRMPYG
jgi:anti-sigma factor RsiW